MRISRRTRRRWLLFLGIGLVGYIVVVAVVGGGISTGDMSCDWGKATDPAGRVQAALYSLESRDINKVTPYFSPPAAAQMHVRLISVYESCDALKVTNLQTTKLYESGDVARVMATYDIIYTTGTAQATDHREQRVKLVRINDEWYLNEAI